MQGAQVDVDEEQYQTREALLPVNDVIDTLLFANDDQTQKIVRVVPDAFALVTWIVLFEELTREVIDKVTDLLALPLVLELSGNAVEDTQPLSICLEGYRRVRPLVPGAESQLPMFFVEHRCE